MGFYSTVGNVLYQFSNSSSLPRHVMVASLKGELKELECKNSRKTVGPLTGAYCFICED